MQEELQEHKQFRIQDRRSQRIHQKLQRIGPGPASFYLDACRIMSSPSPYETATHLVGHCLREIESALRALLVPQEERAPEKKTFSDRAFRIVEKIESALRALLVPQEERAPEKNTQRQLIRKILETLDIQETDPVAKSWLKVSGKLHRWAHRDSLRGPRPVDKEFIEFWEEMQSVLDVITNSIEEHYARWFPILDELCAKEKPDEEDIKILKNKILNNGVTLSYFFEKLDNPAWLPLLRKSGFFSKPSEPIQNLEEGTIMYPPWPEAKYLTKMASISGKTAKRVAQIILEMKESDNQRALYELIETIISMPPEISSELVGVVCEWLKKPLVHFWFVDKAGQLLVHLAVGKQYERAIQVAGCILNVDSKDDYAKRSDIKVILDKYIPAIRTEAPRLTLNLLVRKLEEAVTFSQFGKDDAEQEFLRNDYSSIWYRAIESDEKGRRTEQMLVLAVREAADELLTQDPSKLAEIIRMLEHRKWFVFQRIALYLLLKYGSVNYRLVRDRLLEEELVYNDESWHEYSVLLKEHFAGLEDEDKETILGLIMRDRKLAAIEPERQEEVDKLIRKERYKRLSLIADSLPQQWMSTYGELRDEFGEIDDAEFTAPESAAWVGPTSPITAVEIKELTVKEIVEYLETWEAPNTFMEDSPEGLGRELVKVIKEDPVRFAEEAALFQDLDPTYIRALLRGLSESLKNAGTFPWEGVLQLCQWIINQKREIPDREAIRGQDKDWIWTRGAVVDLLQLGLMEALGEIPFNFRETVSGILQELAEDPEPTIDDEEEFFKNDRDPVDLAINTVRGQAINAFIIYGLWAMRAMVKAGGVKRDSWSLNLIPELQQVLENHLNPEHDSSLAIRSVYGWRLPSLVYLDVAWVREHLHEIFPNNADQRGFHDAAWEAFLLSCKPNKNIYMILKDEYELAIDRLSSQSREIEPHDPELALIEHLIQIYSHGDMPFTSIVRMFENASNELHALAIDYCGRFAGESDLSPEEKGRLRYLWEERLARNIEFPQSAEEELAAFGWWFSSEAFDISWAIDQMLEVLKLIGRIEADHLVVDKLAALYDERPKEVILAIQKLIEGDEDGTAILGWREEAMMILKNAIGNDDDEIRRMAEKAINLLCSRGYLEFRQEFPR